MYSVQFYMDTLFKLDGCNGKSISLNEISARSRKRKDITKTVLDIVTRKKLRIFNSLEYIALEILQHSTFGTEEF